MDYQLKLKGQMLKDIPYGVVVRRGNRSDLKISSSDPDLFNWLAVGGPPYIAPGIMDWLSRFR